MLLEPFRADTPLLSQRLLLLRLSGLRCLPGRGDRVQALPRQRLLVLQRRWGKGRNRWTCNTHLVIHFDFFEFKFKFDVCAPAYSTCLSGPVGKSISAKLVCVEKPTPG